MVKIVNLTYMLPRFSQRVTTTTVWQVLGSRPLAHLLPPRSTQTPLLWPPGRLYSLTNMALMMEMKAELLTFLLRHASVSVHARGRSCVERSHVFPR